MITGGGWPSYGYRNARAISPTGGGNSSGNGSRPTGIVANVCAPKFGRTECVTVVVVAVVVGGGGGVQCTTHRGGACRRNATAMMMMMMMMARSTTMGRFGRYVRPAASLTTGPCTRARSRPSPPPGPFFRTGALFRADRLFDVSLGPSDRHHFFLIGQLTAVNPRIEPFVRTEPTESEPWNRPCLRTLDVCHRSWRSTDADRRRLSAETGIIFHFFFYTVCVIFTETNETRFAVVLLTLGRKRNLWRTCALSRLLTINSIYSKSRIIQFVMCSADHKRLSWLFSIFSKYLNESPQSMWKNATLDRKRLLYSL